VNDHTAYIVLGFVCGAVVSACLLIGTLGMGDRRLKNDNIGLMQEINRYKSLIENLLIATHVLTKRFELSDRELSIMKGESTGRL
jgi:hypothetical protein